jgi:hypothetical protein
MSGNLRKVSLNWFCILLNGFFDIIRFRGIVILFSVVMETLEVYNVQM